MTRCRLHVLNVIIWINSPGVASVGECDEWLKETDRVSSPGKHWLLRNERAFVCDKLSALLEHGLLMSQYLDLSLCSEVATGAVVLRVSCDSLWVGIMCLVSAFNRHWVRSYWRFQVGPFINVELTKVAFIAGHYCCICTDVACNFSLLLDLMIRLHMLQDYRRTHKNKSSFNCCNKSYTWIWGRLVARSSCRRAIWGSRDLHEAYDTRTGLHWTSWM